MHPVPQSLPLSSHKHSMAHWRTSNVQLTRKNLLENDQIELDKYCGGK